MQTMQAIGTPLVRINRLIKSDATVLAKVESRNPAFSVKMPYRRSVDCGCGKTWCTKTGMHIVEPTSGNYRYCFSVCCSSKGYPITLTMPASMSFRA